VAEDPTIVGKQNAAVSFASSFALGEAGSNERRLNLSASNPSAENARAGRWRSSPEIPGLRSRLLSKDREKDLLSYLFVRTILKCKSKRKNAKDCCPDVLLCQIKRTSGCICRFERVPRL
jgi:hypothetical protein